MEQSFRGRKKAWDIVRKNEDGPGTFEGKIRKTFNGATLRLRQHQI